MKNTGFTGDDNIILAKVLGGIHVRKDGGIDGCLGGEIQPRASYHWRGWTGAGNCYGRHGDQRWAHQAKVTAIERVT
jgi:hypothetical protein